MAAAVLNGGEKLRRVLADIAAKMRNGGTLKVGFLSNSSYSDGKPVAMIAAIQNWGAPAVGIPPRPFFTNMIVRHSGEWPDEIRAQLKSTDYDVRVTMNRMGALIAGELQQSIRDTNEPPLKPATIRRKGFDKPLIDSARMINSVAFEYEERGESSPRAAGRQPVGGRHTLPGYEEFRAADEPMYPLAWEGKRGKR